MIESSVIFNEALNCTTLELKLSKIGQAYRDPANSELHHTGIETKQKIDSGSYRIDSELHHTGIETNRRAYYRQTKNALNCTTLELKPPAVGTLYMSDVPLNCTTLELKL